MRGEGVETEIGTGTGIVEGPGTEIAEVEIETETGKPF